MLNNYAESGGGFSNNHGQTSRTTTEGQKQQNIGSTWGYNSQLEGMYYGTEPQPVYMGPYDGSTKNSSYTQYPSGTIHQPVPTPVVKCHEACCQHFPDHRYPLNPAPLRYQPSGPIQPRYADLSGSSDSRQYFTDRRSMQQGLSRKKVYSAENGYPNISERHFSQYMGRGQMHMADSRQQMQMMRSQYPMYPSYWGGARTWTGPRMNCPPPPTYHQSVNQGAQLQSGLKMTDASHFLDPSTQKPISAQHRRGVAAGGTEIIRPVPEPKRSLNPNLPSCYEFGYPAGFVPFSEVNKGGGLKSQSNSSNCKITNDKQYPHQMQYPIQNSDRSMMNCNSAINDLSYSLNFPMTGNESYVRSGLEEGQQISDSRKMPLQFDSLGKKRPDLDLRQYLATWEDDEDENTRLTEPLTLGNSGAPYIVVDCRSLESEAAAKLQERYKAIPPSQSCTSKSRSSSPNNDKRSEELPQQNENNERGGLHSSFPTQTPYAPSMPTLISDSDKNVNFWNGTTREGEGTIGKGGAFQPLDCSKRDANIDPKRDSHLRNELSTQKLPSNNESANMSFDALVSFYGDNRRTVDGYDFVEMTERLVNNSEKSSTNNRTSLDQHPDITRPCDPRLQQSQLGNNPSIYNKVASRYPSGNYQHFKPNMTMDPYYNYKHPMPTSKYYGFENSQLVDPNYDYHKIISDFDSARLFGNKEPPKDSRRIFHPELDKSLDSAFIDPIRKTQITDCFQDKGNLEFGSVDPDQFMAPIVMKKSDLDNRLDKSIALRERVDGINNENQPEKTVLITSQNGQPEIFRVPFSPDKELSNKDNVVTLHSVDQTKNNTITVEVPYVHHYSTLVKLSEEISRSDKSDNKSKSNTSESNLATKTLDEFKKPTSFKLKRKPNSKEWTVADKNTDDIIEKTISNNGSTSIEHGLPFENTEERDTLKSSVTVSNLNMPSLDDIRDGDDICENVPDTNLSNVSESTSSICSDNKNIHSQASTQKTNLQIPQMAVVQPMKLNQPETEQPIEPNLSINSFEEGDKNNSTPDLLLTSTPTNTNQICFESDKISENSSSVLVPENDISKHNNFRSHKKIQDISSSIPNCLSSPNEEFLHPQELNPGDGKEPYSPFHVYSDCDMNSQISDYFKLDERTPSDKILDARMPSSPGVEGMFEDINHSNANQLYQSKSCNFQDLTDPNMVPISSNTDFQSFSNIFTEESDKVGRSDGSVLQMNDKKYLKEIFDDIEKQHVLKSLEGQESNTTDYKTGENADIHVMSNESDPSPPIPPISLKLNETKKIWCIAKKDGERPSQNLPILDTKLKCASPVKQPICLEDNIETIAYLVNNDNNTDRSADISVEDDDSVNNLEEKEHNYCVDKQNKSILNKLIFNRVKESHISHSLSTSSEVHQEAATSSQNGFPIVDSQGIDGFQSNVQNQCLSMLKYCPKVKIFNKIKSLNITHSESEALIYDEKGTHFPILCESDKTQLKHGELIVRDIIESLITESINNSNLSIEKMDTGNPVSFQNNYSDDYEVSVESVSPINTQSVIKFDNSSFINQKENGSAKTTEIFMQFEKENLHHSVIKAVPSEDGRCNLDENKITVRSIFSPMSDINEEVSSNDNNVKSVNQEDNTMQDNNLNIVEGANYVENNKVNLLDSNGDSNVGLLDCSLSKTVTTEVINDEDSSLKNYFSNLKDKSRFDDDEFRGFASPDTNSYLNKDEESCRKKGFEIDDALELMGLTNDKDDKGHPIPMATESSELFPVKGPIEHNIVVPQSNLKLVKTCYISSPDTDHVSSGEDDKCSQLQIPDSKEVNHFGTNNEFFCNDITQSQVLDPADNTSDNEIVSPFVQNNNSGIAQEEHFSKVDNMHDDKYFHSNYIVEPPKNSSEPTLPSAHDQCETNTGINNNCDSEHSQKTYSPRSPKRTSSEIDSNDTSIARNSKISKHTTRLCPDTSGVINNGNESCIEGGLSEKCATEDFEVSSETSVIVRNNSSNNQVNETVIDECKSSNHSTQICSSQSGDSVDSSQIPHNKGHPTGDSNSVIEFNSSYLKEQHAVDDFVNNNENVVCTRPVKEINSFNNCIPEENHVDINNVTHVSIKTIPSEVDKEEQILDLNQCVLSKDIDKAGSSFKTILNTNVDQYTPYCVSESVFRLCDETEELWKFYSPSYFHSFMKNKWEKFFEIPYKKQNVRYCDKESLCKEFERGHTTIKSSHQSVIHPDSNKITINKQLGNDNDNNCISSSFNLDIGHNYEFEREKYCPITEINTCNDSEKSVLQNEQQTVKSDISKPMGDFSLRRDSLKVMEPEAILKEIFSPDSEIDDFRSEVENSKDVMRDVAIKLKSVKENVGSVKTIQRRSDNVENNINTSITEKEIVASKSSADMNESNLTDDDIFIVLSHHSTDSLNDVKMNDQCESNNKHSMKDLCKQDVTNVDIVQDSINLTYNKKKSTPSNKFYLSDNDSSTNLPDQGNNTKSSDHDSGSTSDDSQKSEVTPPCVEDNSVETTDKQSELTSHDLPTITNSNRPSNIVNSSISSIDNTNLVETSLGVIAKPPMPPTYNVSGEDNRETSPDQNLETKDHDRIKSDSHDEEIISDKLSNVSHQHDVFESTKIESEVVEGVLLKKGTSIKKKLQHNLDSQITKQDIDKENFNISTVTAEVKLKDSCGVIQTDILLSKDILQKDFNEAENFDCHLKNNLNICHKIAENNCSDSQKRKVCSVQDSVKIHHNVNQETFPLQCLVEAALALENVDSKQMLINNSNYSEVYSKSNDSFLKSSNIHELKDEVFNDETSSTKCLPSEEIKMNQKEKICNENILTPADKEIFSKFEETNYNFRASTRIVTSSSSNIIPYPKRKYSLKSKRAGTTADNMQKTPNSLTDKVRTKKRRGCFTYPRSKKRRKNIKDKLKCKDDNPTESNLNSNDKICFNEPDLETEKVFDELQLEERVLNQAEYVKPTSLENSYNELKNLNGNAAHHLAKDSSQTDFGGPLLIANEKMTTQRNVFCVHVNSNKMNDYISGMNLEDLEVLTENKQSSFTDNSITDFSNSVTLENGASLVIIIEELDDHSDKNDLGEIVEGVSDVILDSIESNSSVSSLQQTNSILDDCSDILNTGLSVNESCICPPEYEINSNCDDSLLKESPYEVLVNDTFISKPHFEMNDSIDDDIENDMTKLQCSVNCSEEMSFTSCYEDMNTNLVSDIGNWPFVEEEVAEFDVDPELPNKIPEEGRKIELKCSLPWKKIFNMSKSKKKKSKTSKIVSGLELGPAKVEVRLKAPSAEWKVISDYHENSSPVVKVKRLILQRDSDVSSYSEKDSEEENDSKKQLLLKSIDQGSNKPNKNNNDHNVDKCKKDNNENWQPVVRLTRNKEIDKLTLSLDSKLCPQKESSLCSQVSHCSVNKVYDDFLESHSESETNECVNEKDQFDNENYKSNSSFSNSSHSSENASSNQNSKRELVINLENKGEFDSSYRRSKSQVYETYSPSGDNTLGGDNIYSPSDPHFSPESCNQDSESSSSSREERSDCDDEIDFFLTHNTMTINKKIGNSQSEKQEYTLEKSPHAKENLVKDFRECQKVETDNINSKSGDDFCSVPLVGSCFKNCCNDSSDHVTQNSEFKVDNTLKEQDTATSNEESSKFSQCSEELSNLLTEESKLSNPTLKTKIEHRKSARRKMPKNFFVRKKLRKVTDENSLFGEDSYVHQLEDFVNSQSSSEHLSLETATMRQDSENSSSVESYQSDSQSRKSSLTNDEQFNNSESDIYVQSRLRCVQDLEDTLSLRLNESPVVERFEVKQRLRDSGRGIKRPCEGHSKEDTKRRRKKIRRHSNRCHECDIRFQNKVELGCHEAYVHSTKRRELHHCSLCQRSFSSLTRYRLHEQGRSHRHMELTQRHTVHTIHRLLVGSDCPQLLPLSGFEQRAMQWRPAQPGYAHFYHDLTPLQAALQEHNSEARGEVILSDERLPND